MHVAVVVVVVVVVAVVVGLQFIHPYLISPQYI